MGQLIDLTGKKFSRLTVLRRYTEKLNPTKWVCLCDCGNDCVIAGGKLKNCNTQSCGCLMRERTSLANKKDLTGKRFGRLTIIKEISNRQGRKIIWECVCDCGVLKNIAGNHITHGKTLSCGCYLTDLMKSRSGVNNHRYNPALSDEDRKYNRNEEGYYEWTVNTKRNKNYTCEICLERGGKLHSHHLFGYAEYKDLRQEEWNCAVLCEKCHRKFHTGYGVINNNFKQFAEFYKSVTTKDYENDLAEGYMKNINIYE